MEPLKLIQTTHSAHETLELGERLGRLLKGGETICLMGELGTGKTCLVQGIVKGMGIHSETATSPTFTLHHQYRGRISLHHLDLYRLQQPDELETLGLLDLMEDPESVLVIEWAEKAAGLLPKSRLEIQIRWQKENSRVFEIHAVGEHYRDLIKELQATAPHSDHRSLQI